MVFFQPGKILTTAMTVINVHQNMGYEPYKKVQYMVDAGISIYVVCIYTLILPIIDHT